GAQTSGGSRRAPEPTGVAARPRRGRVLVVEDETMVGDFLRELLQGFGLDVVLHREPLAAMAWLEDAANEAALLITDQTMPQMTGLELARRARELRPALPVVLVSGNAEPFDAKDLERCGVHVTLTKPLAADRLRNVLAELLT
ncbi:response regulator, partial [Piscinibacter sp.]|uniref:response regulator n=1 Tax=Piscinibacter sp. TaxID=1903157 RepID=UPI002BDD7711